MDTVRSGAGRHSRPDVRIGEAPGDAHVLDETAFRILVLADLTGRPEPAQPLLDRTGHAIDRDDLDGVMRSLEPRVELPRETAGQPTTVTFSGLDDFHPDALVERTPIFAALARMPEPAAGPAPASDRPLLDDILERAAPAPIADVAAEDLEAFLRAIVRPHLVAQPTSDQRAAAARREDAAAEALRRILRNPALQSLEATWRALDWLTRRVETSAALRIEVVHATRQELIDHETIEDALSRRFSALGVPTLIVALFRFGGGAGEIGLLGRLARVAARHGTAVVADAEPQLVGAVTPDELAEPRDWDDPNDEWVAFRRTPEARHLLLAMPRFLLRAPYGADGETIDAFPFDEVRSPGAHEDFLWGGSAVLCAALLAETFLAEGWTMRPGRFRDLDGLPLALVRNGEARTVPCAEVVLSESAASAIMARGPAAVVSYRDSDRVRLLDFQSVAEPTSELRGPWSR